MQFDCTRLRYTRFVFLIIVYKTDYYLNMFVIKLHFCTFRPLVLIVYLLNIHSPVYSTALITKLYVPSIIHSFPDNFEIGTNFSFSKYSQMRNFHNSPNPSYAVVVFCNEIAKSLNSTLTFLHFGNENTFKSLKHPTVVPLLITWLKEKSTTTFWNEYTEDWNAAMDNQKQHPLPIFLEIDSFPQNFVYCQEHKISQGSIFAFVSILIEPLDTVVWILLFGFVIAVSIIVYLNAEAKVQNAFSAFLITFSGLLSPVLNGLAIKRNGSKIKESKLFVLWMLVSTLLMSFYCGVMTRNITKPLPDVTLDNINDLVNAGYSIIYSRKLWLESDIDSAKIYNKTSFLKLLNSAIIADDFIYELCYGYKRTYLHIWNIALRTALLAKENLRRMESSSNSRKVSHKDCYVGKEFVEEGPTFYGFLPPFNEEVSDVFRRFFDAGIYNLWEQEYIGLMHSNKVQERVKVVSKNKIFEEQDQIIPPISLNSKVITIFVFWGLCLLFTTFVLIIELTARNIFKLLCTT